MPAPTSPQAGQALLETFGRIIVINLPERIDRRTGMEAELRCIGLSLDHPLVSVFPAVRPADAAGFPAIGAHGAFLSHLGVLEHIVRNGWDRALILEDDVSFSADFSARFGSIAEVLRTEDWDMVYGHCAMRDLPAPRGLVRLPPDRALTLLHFLGMRIETAQQAIPFLRAMLQRPPGSPEGGPMHVDGAYSWFRSAHPELRVFAARPPLAVQRPSRSDIADLRWHDRLPVLRNLSAWVRRLRQRL